MQNNDEKQNIWKIVPVFSFSVFCSGYFYMNFCVFLRKSRVKNTNTAIFTKYFSASIAEIALKTSGKNVKIRKIY